MMDIIFQNGQTYMRIIPKLEFLHDFKESFAGKDVLIQGVDVNINGTVIRVAVYMNNSDYIFEKRAEIYNIQNNIVNQPKYTNYEIEMTLYKITEYTELDDIIRWEDIE